MVHPQRILTKGGAQPGDLLILSKPLGTGLITTAHKRQEVAESDLHAAITSMMQLNRKASQALLEAGASVHAVTDITGFGLLGHAWEMAAQSMAGMRFEFDALPLLPNARHYAEQGHVTGGADRNATYLAPKLIASYYGTHKHRVDFLRPLTRLVGRHSKLSQPWILKSGSGVSARLPDGYRMSPTCGWR